MISADRIRILKNVFWDSGDSLTLREYLYNSNIVNNKTVFEIGTGTGILSLYCADCGASRIVASDVNPQAVRNATLNAQHLGYSHIISVRQVSASDQDIWSVLGTDERFDIILSNPPWEMGEPKQWIDYAFFDPKFRLIHCMIGNFTKYLNPGGRLLLVYGCIEAIEEVRKLCKQHGYSLNIIDNRSFYDLDIRDKYRYGEGQSVFMPGMLLEVMP